MRAAARGAVGLFILVLLVPSVLCAARPSRGTSSRSARRDAIESIPFDKLDPAARAKVDAVLADVSIFRRMPTQVIRCDPDLYLFVVNQPEIIANIWQLLGFEQIVLSPVGPGVYHAADSAGTDGVAEFFYRSHDTHIIYGEGEYEGPLFKRSVTGKCLLVLKSGYVREPDGHYYVTTRLDAFISLEQVGAEFLAKTFQPLIGRVADHNFVATSTFIANLASAAERNPRAMLRMADRLHHVSPEVRERFIDLTDEVAVRAMLREAPRVEGAARRPQRRTARAQGGTGFRGR